MHPQVFTNLWGKELYFEINANKFQFNLFGLGGEGGLIICVIISLCEKVRELVGGESEPVLSCLAGAGAKLAASMKRAILEVVVSGAATTKPEVER